MGAAHFLEDDGHLFLGDDVGGCGDVAAGCGEIHGGIDALDGLGDETQLLVLVLHRGNHVGGVYACKRLIVRVFQL